MDLERTGIGSDDIIRHKSRRWKNLKATRSLYFRSKGIYLLSYLKSRSQYTVMLYVRLDKQLLSYHSWHGCAMWSDVWEDASEHQKAVAKPTLHDWNNMSVNQKYMHATHSHHQTAWFLFTSLSLTRTQPRFENLLLLQYVPLTPVMNIILSWWSDKSSRFQTHSWRPEVPATLCYGFFWSNCYSFRCNILCTAKCTIFLPSYASNQVIQWDV